MNIIWSVLCMFVFFICMLYAFYLVLRSRLGWYERGREHGRWEEQSYSFSLAERVKSLELELAQEKGRYATADKYRNVFSENIKEIERLRSHVAVLAAECKAWREYACLPDDCDPIHLCMDATDATDIPEMET